MLKYNKISFVIPCYGSEKTISKVIENIESTVYQNDDFEIICVNDCSKDNVYKVLCDLAITDKKLKVINLAKNAGQHNAIMCGLRHTSGDVIVCLDDDGQTDPKQCYKLINALDDIHDIAYANYTSKKHSTFRNIGSLINRKMSEYLCDIPKEIVSNSYFACKRFIVDEIIKYEYPYTFLSGLIARTTHNYQNVPIEHFDRFDGHSGYSFSKLISLWLNGFTAFSIKPLRIATLFGFLFAVLGFVFGIYQIINKLINPSVIIGYSSIICAILFIGGMLMIMLWLIGEYIGRIYICINHAPQYIIKEKINCDN